MNKLVCLVLMVLLGLSMAEDVKKEASSNYGAAPPSGYAPPAYNPPAFVPPPFGPPIFPPPPFFPRPFFDSYYCSVQATFPLAFEKHHNVGDDVPSGGYGASGPQGYGSSAPQGYGSAPPQGYGAPYPRKHRHMTVLRQACRYSAATSWKSCNQCCQIASHGLTTSSDRIVGALFYFDPVAKQNNNGHAPGGGAYGGADIPEDGSKFVQCVCCAPRVF